MNTLKIKDNALFWAWNGQYLKIMAWGVHSLRVISGWLPDEPSIPDYALLPVDKIKPDFYQEEGQITIVNGNVSASVDIQGFIIREKNVCWRSYGDSVIMGNISGTSVHSRKRKSAR